MTDPTTASYDAFATEILHNYRTGRRLVGVDGTRPEVGAEFAEHLAEALRRAGHDAETAEVTEDFPDRVAGPFRAGDGAAILVAHGTGLHAPPLSGSWSYTFWLDSGDPVPGSADRLSTAIVDVTDPQHPRRNFADSC
ncbi:hypothetical protein CLV46_2245 [Diaminobutyricimonas aerilata]|uniref:Uncharacterized protein n=1 Tax=Diaminobutyricimonas aerilata TaxID=1162967 RepID=A0A2M9CL98_9MICO|nr:hypothetical protein [Diaminobutyricimonas aerilata]PJJ72671.1 hypothetical protein CLV46_2245 [Diaminobutyricimonas aerilata]